MNLFHISKNDLKGQGHIIEFGSFLGASTAALYDGIQANPNIDDNIHLHIFDSFRTPLNSVFADLVYKYAKSANQEHFLVESDNWLDFFRAFQANVNTESSRVIINVGLLSDLKWKPIPIELLHIDLPKDWSQASIIAKQVFPSLINGSKILFQDFGYQWSGELIAMIGHMIKLDLIKPISIVETTLTCTLVQQFTTMHSDRLISLMNEPRSVIEGIGIASEHCATIASQKCNLILVLAKAQYLYSIKQFDEGLRQIHFVTSHPLYYNNKDLINRVNDLIEHKFLLPKSYEE